MRFATFTDDGEFPVAPAVRRAVAEAVQMLKNAGAMQVPWQFDLGRVKDLFFACLSADRAATYKHLLRDNKVAVKSAPASSRRNVALAADSRRIRA